MPSILIGVRELLKKSLNPGWTGSKTSITATREIITRELNLPTAKELIKEVSDQNTKRSRSQKLWCIRWAQFITPSNADDPKRPEKRLEKAVVRSAAEGGLGRDWANQIPTASGLSRDRGDSRRNIDLAQRIADGHFRFIELKARRGTNTPLSAGVELLEYTLLYVWVRQHRSELLDDKTLPACSQELLEAKEIELEVLAPEEYYRGYDETCMRRLQTEMERAAVDLGNQVDVKMRFRFKILRDFRHQPFPHVTHEWLAHRFINPPDRYPPHAGRGRQ